MAKLNPIAAMVVYGRAHNLTYGQVQRLVDGGKLTYEELGAVRPPEKITDERARACRRCGRTFIPHHPLARYCSDDCREAVNRDRNRRMNWGVKD